MRRSVILRAKAYLHPGCRQDARSLYVAAATRYAETLMRMAGCNNFPRCPVGEGNLDEVWRLNRAVADLEVARAMAAASRAGGLTERSFRGDVGRVVRVIAGTDFRPGPVPSCTASYVRTRRWNTGTRRWRFRFRWRRR